MPAFQDSDRIRKPVRLTMDPDVRERAEAAAAATGLPLSRWIEQLVRAELARIEAKSRPKKK
jgi:predicted HicB family RNase H-like nuclease